MVVVLPLLFLLLSGSSPTAARVADDEKEFIVVAMSSLKPQAVCFGHRVIPPHNGSWVPLNRPLGPCSPSSSSSGAAKPSLGELLRQDQLRVDDIHRRLSDVDGSLRSHKPPSVCRMTQVHHQSTMEANFGSQPSSSKVDPAATDAGRSSLPGVVQTLVLDTASDVAWVQCVPCPVPPCHPQTDTVYDPTRSSTSAVFSCNSPACRRLGPYANGCVNNQCQYRVAYPDGSSSSGTYSSDLLTLDATNSITNFQFGCSHAEQNSASFDTATAGIMALGGGSQSLVSQAPAATYENTFSYCIPPTESSSGFFVLGVPRVAASRYVVTPMLRDKRVRTFYRVLLKDIAVARQRLGVPATVFAAGTVLDTRTVITRLPPTAYQALRAAFKNSMSMYRSAPPKGNLDTCYDFTGVGTVRLPRIALVFDHNAVVELDPSAVLFNDCLAFVPNRDDRAAGVLGNVQQQTIEVLYDVGGGSVGFRRGAC